MSFIYEMFGYIGYFWILIVFLILAIILAKKLYSWIFYLLGAGITFLSLYGNQKSYIAYYGEYLSKDYIRPYWITYIVLLALGAFLMISRYWKAKK